MSEEGVERHGGGRKWCVQCGRRMYPELRSVLKGVCVFCRVLEEQPFETSLCEDWLNPSEKGAFGGHKWGVPIVCPVR